MNKKADTHNIQTLTVVGKVAHPDDAVALRLGLLGFAATKLWNTALWHTKEQWNATGKIPGFPEVDRHLKSIACRWYRSLHAQSAQAVLEELNGAYRSWFALRKKGVPDAKPPGFRKKTTLSTVTFKKDSLRWNPETNTLRLGIPKAVFGEPFLHLPVQLPPGREIDPGRIQLVRLFHDKGDWFVHLVCDLPVPEQKADGHVLAIDLGMNVVAATACTDGRTMLWSGGELASLERYFEKEKSACTDSQSNKSRRLNRKRSRQRTHLLHSLTRAIVNDAHARGVATLVIGDLTDIRKGKRRERPKTGPTPAIRRCTNGRTNASPTCSVTRLACSGSPWKRSARDIPARIAANAARGGKPAAFIAGCTPARSVGLKSTPTSTEPSTFCKGISRKPRFLGVVAVWHSLRSTGSPGEIPGHSPMNRGRGGVTSRCFREHSSCR